MRVFILSALSILLASCTVQQEQGEIRSEFHPPLVKRNWNLQEGRTPAGNTICELRANSLGVQIERTPQGQTIERVYYTPGVDPGEEWSLRIQSLVLRSRTDALNKNDSAKAVMRMREGGMAYTELMKNMRMGNADYTRIGDSISLDEFGELYQQCQSGLTQPRR